MGAALRLTKTFYVLLFAVVGSFRFYRGLREGADTSAGAGEGPELFRFVRESHRTFGMENAGTLASGVVHSAKVCDKDSGLSN